MTLSDLQITTELKQKVLDTLRHDNEEEKEAWQSLFSVMPIAETNRAEWQELMETILREPQRYNYELLGSIMERYRSLVSSTTEKIPAEIERNLNLP